MASLGRPRSVLEPSPAPGTPFYLDIQVARPYGFAARVGDNARLLGDPANPATSQSPEAPDRPV